MFATLVLIAEEIAALPAQPPVIYSRLVGPSGQVSARCARHVRCSPFSATDGGWNSDPQGIP